MDDIQERLEHYEAKDRERQELEDKIKECDLNFFRISKDKSELDEEARAVYLQRCELLRQYRRKYGHEAEYQLRGQLDEARKVYAEQYEAKDRERKEREAEIMRHDLQLLMYARNHATPDDDYCRKYMRRNAMIWDYGNTYGTEAQAHLREMLDEARKKFLARVHELEEVAEE